MGHSTMPVSKITKLALTVGLAAASIETEFEAWRSEHQSDKYYTGEGYKAALKAFEANKIMVEKHNAKPGMTWKAALTPYADMTSEEFNAFYLGTKPRPEGFQAPGGVYVPKGNSNSSVDWREHGAVNPVKNQAQCGSCWAFSTIQAFEGQTAIKNGKLENLSEQDLVDCVKNTPVNGSECCDGCQGGLMDAAFHYMVDKQGGKGATEDSYPYRAVTGECKFKTSTASAATIKNWTDVKSYDEVALADAVANVGPISIAVNAQSGWQLYGGGIFNGFLGLGCNGDASKLDHGVGIVGYGTDSSKGDYWIIRNSWGAGWGESGYMRLKRGVNACGVSDTPSFPNL